MFAVIKTGGKQYKVMPGDVITVEHLEGEAGHKINISDVLMVGDDKASTIGTPLVAKSEVKVMIVEQGRSDKVIVFKKKRRQNYRRKAGHRQHLTCLWVEDIVVNGKSHPATNKVEPRAKIKSETVASEKKKAAPVKAEKAAAPKEKAATKSAAKPAAPKAAKAEPKAAAPKKPAAEKKTK